LGLLGWSKVEEYWNRVPELQALRDEFDQAGEARENELMKDAEYRAAYDEYQDSTGSHYNRENYDKFDKICSSVRSRLMQNEEFKQINKAWRDTLFASNIQTLEYIINDYEKKSEEFPVDWITKASVNGKWMSNAEFRDLTEKLGRNGFWWDDYWVTEINGRCSDDGKIEYNFRYEPLPPDGRFEWQSCFGTDEELFEKRREAYAVYAGRGLELVHEQSYTLPNGEKRYQAVWHQPSAHLEGNSGNE
jgi:hypothetical protein